LVANPVENRVRGHGLPAAFKEAAAHDEQQQKPDKNG
jgi:hypothetical protein